MNEDKTVEQLRCPECDGLVHNRRFPLCEFCKTPLPKEFQLSEKEKIESKQLKEKQKLDKEKENWSFLYDRDTSSGGDGGYATN